GVVCQPRKSGPPSPPNLGRPARYLIGRRLRAILIIYVSMLIITHVVAFYFLLRPLVSKEWATEIVDTLKAGDLTCPTSLPHLPTRPSVQARSRLPKLGSLAASASVTTPKLAPSLWCRMRLSRFS